MFRPRQMMKVGSGAFWAPAFFVLCVLMGTIPVDARDGGALRERIGAAEPGERIELPAGTIELTRTLTITKPITLVGQGADETTIRSVADQPGEMIRIEGVAGVHLAHFTIDGAENPNATQGVVLVDGEDHRLVNLRIRGLVGGEGFGPHAIYALGNLADSRIVRNEIHDIGLDSKWGAGIRLAEGCRGILIAHNVIRRVGRGGILTAHCTDMVIADNEVRHYGVSGPGLGIELWGGGGGVVIEDNRVDHWISVDGQTDVAVRRNTIAPEGDRLGSYGLELVSSRRVIMTDNVIAGGVHIGLSVSNDQRKDLAFWARNTVRGCETWGAQIQGDDEGAHRMYFHANTIEQTRKTDRSLYPGAAGHGFRFNNNSYRMVLDGNRITGNAGAGIQIGGGDVDRLTFINNTITGNGGPAVISGGGEPGGFQGEHALWADNEVADNAGGDRGLDNKGFGRREDWPSGEIAASGEPAATRPITFSIEGFDTGEIDEVLWDMDEGLPQTGESVEFIYTSPGTYTISAIVWLESGRGVLVQKELAVEAE